MVFFSSKSTASIIYRFSIQHSGHTYPWLATSLKGLLKTVKHDQLTQRQFKMWIACHCFINSSHSRRLTKIEFISKQKDAVDRIHSWTPQQFSSFLCTIICDGGDCIIVHCTINWTMNGIHYSPVILIRNYFFRREYHIIFCIFPLIQ